MTVATIEFSSLSNEDLYNQCMRGDEQAWQYVYNYILLLCRKNHWDRSEAPEDTAQSVISHLLTKGIDQVREIAAFRGFIRMVTLNFIKDQARKKKLATISIHRDERDDNPGIEPISRAPGPEQQLMSEGLLASFSEAVEQMTDTCRSILGGYIQFKLGVYEDYQSLAQAFELTVSTYSSRVKRCLDQLRQHDEIGNWLEA